MIQELCYQPGALAEVLIKKGRDTDDKAVASGGKGLHDFACGPANRIRLAGARWPRDHQQPMDPVSPPVMEPVQRVAE
jgi:hypothetical protein